MSDGFLLDKVESLKAATLGLGGLCDHRSVISAGYHLCEDVVSETGVCGRLGRYLPEFGEELFRTEKYMADAMDRTHSGASSRAGDLNDLKFKVGERDAQTVISHLDRLLLYFKDLDSRFLLVEQNLERLSDRAKELRRICVRHKVCRSITGRVMLFSGCAALVWAGAALLTRHTAAIAASSFSTAASWVFHRKPMSTGMSGGLVAMLGRKAISAAALHERLAVEFEAFVTDVKGQVQINQSLRTRLKRMTRAVEQAVTLFRVQNVVSGVDSAVWAELEHWIESYEEALGRLMKGSVRFT